MGTTLTGGTSAGSFSTSLPGNTSSVGIRPSFAVEGGTDFSLAVFMERVVILTLLVFSTPVVVVALLALLIINIAIGED